MAPLQGEGGSHPPFNASSISVSVKTRLAILNEQGKCVDFFTNLRYCRVEWRFSKGRTTALFDNGLG
jgi:hypothetical protein